MNQECLWWYIYLFQTSQNDDVINRHQWEVSFHMNRHYSYSKECRQNIQLSGILSYLYHRPITFPHTCREVLEKIIGTMPSISSFTWPKWRCMNLFWVSHIVFDDHLVVIFQVSLVNSSFVMNVYKAYNLPILHPLLWKAFQYTL